jgi:transposase-like protein
MERRLRPWRVDETYVRVKRKLLDIAYERIKSNGILIRRGRIIRTRESENEELYIPPTSRPIY